MALVNMAEASVRTEQRRQLREMDIPISDSSESSSSSNIEVLPADGRKRSKKTEVQKKSKRFVKDFMQQNGTHADD